MQYLVGRVVAVFAVIAVLVVAVGCGDVPHVGANDDEQNAEQEDEDVECETSDDCEDDEYCDDHEQVCKPADTLAECYDDDDCPGSSRQCIDNECRFVSRQCSTVGEQCDPGEPVADGFGCEDLGRGYQCYETCRQSRVCIADHEDWELEREGLIPSEDHEDIGYELFCNRAQTCVTDGVDQPVCQPGECDGFLRGPDDCQPLVNEYPDSFEHGVHCLPNEDGTAECQPAGVAGEGEYCDDTGDCAEGLTCVDRMAQRGMDPTPGFLGDDSFCAPACNSDDMCEDDQECIGDDHGVYDGAGICGDRCEPFYTDQQQCDDETACVPISSEDGLCYRDRETDPDEQRDYYESCSSTSQCPDSAHCFGGTCHPLCDPTISSSEQPETCPPPADGRELGGDCLDLNRQRSGADQFIPPQIGSGICLEECDGSGDFAQGYCTGEDNYCTPVGAGTSWCLPGQANYPGGECQQDTDCGEGMHCDGEGSGFGTCRPYCQPGEQTNDELGCRSGETCIPREGYDNLGECRVGCEPGDDHMDPNCPEGQKTCVGHGAQAHCVASGDLTHGQNCGDPSVQNCAPGMVCARSGDDFIGVLFDPFTDPDSDEDGVATCRKICSPFSAEHEESGCPDDYYCSPVAPEGPSRVYGHCVPAVDSTEQYERFEECEAADEGKMCADNSFCLAAGGQDNACVDETFQCVQFCDYTTGAGCPGQTTCSEGFSGGPLLGWLGVCT